MKTYSKIDSSISLISDYRQIKSLLLCFFNKKVFVVRIYVVLLLILALISCQKNQKVNENLQNYVMDLGEEQTIDWASIIHIKKIIPLESTDCSLLSFARKCIVRDTKILFQDDKTSALYLFDLEGNFLFSINSRGGGRGEYIELRDADFNYDASEILVLDPTAILSYDAVDGHFLWKRNLEDNFYNIVNPDKNLFYLWTDNGKYSLYRLDEKGLSGIRERKSFQLVAEHFFSRKNGSCLLSPDYGFFEIAEITGSEILPKYNIDFGDKALPETDLPQNYDQFEATEKNDFFKCLTDIRETDNYLYVLAVGPESSYFEILINKNTQNVRIGKPDRKTSLVITDADSSSFWGIVYPDYISEESSLMNSVKKYIKEDANPILIQFTVE